MKRRLARSPWTRIIAGSASSPARASAPRRDDQLFGDRTLCTAKRATDRVSYSAGVNVPLIRRAEQDAIAFERGYLLPGIAEIFGQHLAIVFTEKRCVELEFVRKRREPQRESRDLKIAENPIMNGSHCSPFAKMRMSHRFFNAEHWSVWNMRLAHDPHSRFISRQSHQPLADFRIDEIAISYTAAMLGASRIID